MIRPLTAVSEEFQRCCSLTGTSNCSLHRRRRRGWEWSTHYSVVTQANLFPKINSPTYATLSLCLSVCARLKRPLVLPHCSLFVAAPGQTIAGWQWRETSLWLVLVHCLRRLWPSVVSRKSPRFVWLVVSKRIRNLVRPEGPRTAPEIILERLSTDSPPKPTLEFTSGKRFSMSSCAPKPQHVDQTMGFSKPNQCSRSLPLSLIWLFHNLFNSCPHHSSFSVCLVHWPQIWIN